jgi:hypothetical protein
MRYALHVIVKKLDGTTEITHPTGEEKDNKLLTQGKLLDAIAHELRKHEDFASSFAITVVADRTPEV